MDPVRHCTKGPAPLATAVLVYAALLSSPTEAQTFDPIDHSTCSAELPKPLTPFGVAKEYSAARARNCVGSSKARLNNGDIINVRVTHTLPLSYHIVIVGLAPAATASQATPTQNPKRIANRASASADTIPTALRVPGISTWKDVADSLRPQLGRNPFTAAEAEALARDVCDADRPATLSPSELRLEVSLGCQSGTPNGELRASFVHDSKYGGYLISVVPIDDKLPPPPPYLGSFTYTLTVLTKEWRLAADAGFVFSGLTNPVYATTDTMIGSTSVKVLHEEPGQRDKFASGVVTMLTVYHTSFPLLSPAFGTGFTSDGHALFLLGGAIRLGEVAAISIGGIYGQVKTPPVGTVLGVTPVDANAPSHTGLHGVTRFFLGITFRFLGGSQAEVQKAYAGLEPTVSHP